METHLNVFLVVFISFGLGLRITKEHGQVVQEIVLNFAKNDSESFTGQRNFQAFTKTIPNISVVLELDADSHIKSACVKSGLWAIFNSPNYRNISAILYASSQPDDQACTNEDDSNITGQISRFSQYESIRFIGNSNLLSPGLSLYKSTFFGGDELYFDGVRLSLPMSIEFQSYGFTGKHNWSFYEKPGFQGGLSCLISSYSENETNYEDYDAVSYNKDVKIVVGSIKRGCESVQLNTHIDESNTLKLKSSITNMTYLQIASGDLRLPQSLKFTTRYLINDNSSFSVYSGIKFDGNYMCLNGTDSSPSEQVLSIGSIKYNGCFPPVAIEIKESRKPKGLSFPDRKEIAAGNPGNQIFFISFLIGLAFLLLIILLAIGLTIYMYVSRNE